MSDTSRKQDEREFDCQECRTGNERVEPLFNKRKGRLCYKFSSTSERKEHLNATNQTELLKVYSESEDWQKKERLPGHFEDVLKGFGMCIWSWPFGLQEVNAMWVMSRCSMESSIVMPYPSLPLDEHPAIFFDFLDVYNKAKYDYYEFKQKKSPPI